MISGNLGYGLLIHGAGTDGNLVLGNYVGPTVYNHTGDPKAGNALDGVSIAEGASRNTVGGARDNADCVGPCNLISGNSARGVLIASPVGGMANGDDGTTDNVIGGAPAAGVGCTGTCNLISSNALSVVTVNGSSTVGITIRGNAIAKNGGLGIDLGGGEFTLNVPSGSGPNRLVKFSE